MKKMTEHQRDLLVRAEDGVWLSAWSRDAFKLVKLGYAEWSISGATVRLLNLTVAGRAALAKSRSDAR